MVIVSRYPVIRVTAMPADSNAYGDIFGGWMMSLMDVGAWADYGPSISSSSPRT